MGPTAASTPPSFCKGTPTGTPSTKQKELPPSARVVEGNGLQIRKSWVRIPPRCFQNTNTMNKNTHILAHPKTNEVFSFTESGVYGELILIKKDGEEYRDEQVATPHDERDGFYSLRIARKLWEALASEGFKKGLKTR